MIDVVVEPVGHDREPLRQVGGIAEWPLRISLEARRAEVPSSYPLGSAATDTFSDAVDNVSAPGSTSALAAAIDLGPNHSELAADGA